MTDPWLDSLRLAMQKDMDEQIINGSFNDMPEVKPLTREQLRVIMGNNSSSNNKQDGIEQMPLPLRVTVIGTRKICVCGDCRANLFEQDWDAHNEWHDKNRGIFALSARMNNIEEQITNLIERVDGMGLHLTTKAGLDFVNNFKTANEELTTAMLETLEQIEEDMRVTKVRLREIRRERGKTVRVRPRPVPKDGE